MQTQPYLLVSGLFFGVVALLHLLRIINQWAFELGPYSLPMFFSWFGVVGPALLCLWAFRLALGGR